MVELERFENAELFKKINDLPVRTIVETPFYGNNVTKIESVAQAYELAKNSPGTLELTGMPVYKPEAQGLPKGANVLMFNDGGRPPHRRHARRGHGRAVQDRARSRLSGAFPPFLRSRNGGRA